MNVDQSQRSRVDVVDLARPFTQGRLRLYLTIASIQGLVTLICAVGVSTGVLPAARSLDVVANVFNVLAMVLLPALVVALVADPVRRGAELILVWLPFTAMAQLTFELAWVIGQPLDWWKAEGDPGGTWMWWQFAQTDTRYFGDNPAIFALELTAVVAAIPVLLAFRQLIRVDLTDRARVKALFMAGAGLAVLTSNTLFYFASLARDGFDAIGQGDYGMVKMIALNVPYLIVPVFVLIAIGRQIDWLYQRAAADLSGEVQ
ncbi:hypothetical protein FB382_003199 [Nocardioides ginsengisegetis]|uniref:Emopamil binding protein n=1 Tax=Nocardioides ginsengisegetis TaxID=661491 RepID=A0A7W3J243_9ACTN|nr:emopamil-binding protein [Nocardioides ginsengisegetis]MBA8804908.1 hypothetical protein [Nocardioides ginsengisegetis]